MKNLSLLGILLLVFFSCRNDIEDDGSITVMETPPVIIDNYDPNSEIVEGTIYGKVYDENENPIADASIKYDGKTYKSDGEGRFFIENEALDRQGTFFTVEAEGYFKGSRRIYPKDGAVNYAYVQLLEINNIGTFNSADGGNMLGDDGISISFTPNSISSATGDLYNGPVTVAAKWLDPTASNLGEIMPGSLLGLNSRVEEVSLVTFGMMAVELFDENGNKVNIAVGNTATLSFPVPQELLDDAPTEIPLWSFEDEQYGIWAEEGVATLQGDKYVGQVSHFSFWNCDAPFPLVYIEGQLVTADGAPLSNVNIGIYPDGGETGAFGITDNEGFFAGKMPKGQDLILKVGYIDEDCLFSSINLGSFDADTNVGEAKLQETGSDFEISGSVVDCDNNPITNALIKLTVGNIKTEYLLHDDNTFSTSLLNCDNAAELTITVIDLENFTEGAPTTVAITPNVDFGELQACGVQLTEFFTLNVDGQTSSEFTDLVASFESPANTDYLFVNIGLDTLSNDKFIFNLEMATGGVGTYTKDDIYSLVVNISEPEFNVDARMYCNTIQGNCAELSSLEFIITENGGINGYLGGNFNGVAIFTDNVDENIMNSYPLSGEFRVPIR